ncbi:MAG: GNAT family N-acetyltransferase [Gammaproteobacteria bacterium]|nr:GNAT family N-acetyltransferase [Gammaproteobacteria bacterium]
MKLTTTQSLQHIPAEAWNALAGDSNPFIQHDFLLALESGECLQPFGWYPQYILAWSDSDELIGASPAYIKTNSYGEFVFDWAWADAYQRAGLEYYPKLVVAIPFTPATGPRLLAKNDNPEIKQALILHTIEFAQKNQLSTIHWLFNQKDNQEILSKFDLLTRFDYQFHWTNNNYKSFDEFLSELNSKKRKNIKRERRKVKESGIEIKTIQGKDLTEEQWQQLYNFYQITFMKKHGTATLSLNFFKAIANKILAIFAYDNLQAVAGAICISGKNSLYGRHWGCHENYDSLHFEVCYYTGIEYCIHNNIQYFEPGAQGEHKISRGFLPTKTLSCHWVADERFKQILAEHLQHESQAMADYGKALIQASPYKKPDDTQ